MEKLKKYNVKRNFKVTNEPMGKTKKAKKKNLTFVVQHHIASHDHYDFRLEWKGVLLSWAVPKGPSFNPSQKRLAVQVEDHPLDYATFEGTIPKGQYGGGTVMLWDIGTWEPLVDVDQGLKSGSLKFTLFGERLKGNWALVKLEDNNWLLLKEKDKFYKNSDGISKFTTSVKTGRTMKEIENNVTKSKAKTKNPFSKTEVQLAKLQTQAPNEEGWVYEMKYDGYRIVAYVENGKTKLMTRNHKDFTNRFLEIANSLNQFSAGRSMVLDGEIIITNEKGKSDFQLLQNYLKQKNNYPLTYVVFDILALDGQDLRNKPLIERKEILENLLNNAPQNIHYSAYVKGDGNKIFNMACQKQLEGIIAKKENSTYSQSRSGDWIKLKCANRQEFVIGGYIKTKNKQKGISSLMLGYYGNGELIYAGKTGTGMTESFRVELEKMLNKIKIKTCPFNTTPKTKSNEKIVFVSPKLIAEVQFAEWTQDNQLRQASFKGLREDKEAKNVVMEKQNTSLPNVKQKSKKTKEKENEITITNPNKIVFTKPKITKQQVVDYYKQVAKHMFPYVEGRIISIVRCPNGFKNQCFFKKHPDSDLDGISKVKVKSSNDKNNEYFYINSLNGIVYEAQMNTIEFHTWGSKVNNIDKPDIMVFDLDPDEKMSLNDVRQGVKDLKKILDKLKLKSFLKTSGGKGYHVVVPFKPCVNWDKFYEFSKTIAKIMEEIWPDKYTSNMRKANRKNKIFIDWVRNGKGATSVAPYSLRAREGGKVSMPITWKELDTIAPNQIDMFEALNRLKKPNPWKNFFNVNQQINN